jgi:CRP-like cAMP-binding protein
MDIAKIQSLAEQVPALSEFSEEALKGLIRRGRILKADKGTVIIHEGRLGHGLFVCLEGTLTVRRQVFDRFPVFANLHAGDLFGEIALLTGDVSTATLITSTDCLLLLLPTKAINGAMNEGDPIIFSLLRKVVSTIQERTLTTIGRMVDVYGDPQKHIPLFERMYRRSKGTAKSSDS